MSNNILFIFEGRKTEKNITDNLTKYFVNENTIITCAYCTTIYKMYTDIIEDEFLDTFSLVKNIDTNKERLKTFKRSDFAEIYMFFDYDGHASNANDQKLSNLLEFFNEETEMGKLYISYPMVEALKHIENFDTFENLKVSCKDFKKYKKTVSKNCIESFKHYHLYQIDTWKILIQAHLSKMNKIVNEKFEFPISIIDQLTIFYKQLEKYKNIDDTIAVLSA
ncbi:MAG: hypothetical protein EOM78_21925, partial [Erysipelotrichia bacterium]|nr:hypothetical protein [Erysipelotrichia bacterium]